jgi:hypothetical protein
VVVGWHNLSFKIEEVFIHFESAGECDDCGNPRSIVEMVMNRSDRSLKLCVACYWALVQALNYASGKLKVASRSQPTGSRDDPSKDDFRRERTKARYLNLLKRQSQQLRELGFLGSLSADSLARTESQLEELDLNTLKAIARAARSLLLRAKASHDTDTRKATIPAPAR